MTAVMRNRLRPVLFLVGVPAILAAQTPGLDSATLERRLDGAEALNRAFASVRGGSVAPMWFGQGARFAYRVLVGDTGWFVVAPERNTIGRIAADSVPRPPAPGEASALWTDAPDAGGIVIRDSAGRVALRVTAEDRYGWGGAPRRWSPDGRFMMAERFDQRAVHRIPFVDYGTAIERVQMVAYAKSGTPLPRTEFHVMDPAAGQVRHVLVDTAEAYAWFIGWRNNTEALVLRLSRDAKTLELLAVDAATAKARQVVVERRPESFVAGLDFATGGFLRAVTVLPDGEHFVWFSERDGWRHAYLYSFDGRLVRQLTRGPFPVHGVALADPRGRGLYVVASGDTTRPYDQHVYRVGLDGRGWRQLTQQPGMHDPVFAPNGEYFVDRHSSVDRPAASELRRADGSLVRVLETADVSALTAIGYQPPEIFRARASQGTEPLYGAIFRPPGFDSTRRYPVLLYIYAGPFISVLPKTYVGTAQQQLAAGMARMGYVVALVDARGTPGRSKAFQDAVYGRIGEIEIPEQVAAIREAAASRPYMDLDRAGVFGHSWGGYFAIRAMLTQPQLFKVGYGGAPGELTEAAMINEPYQGLRRGREQEFDRSSNLPLAGALRGKLKLMHGTSDGNAPLSTTMRIVDALIKANKPYDLLIMPGQGHNPPGPFGVYYRRDMRRYFATHLPPT
jgi:dipeptidyl aminopeptidase/acylaminoacyl peptidase